MKKLLKLFLLAVMLYPAHNLFAQESIIQDILDPVGSIVVNTTVGSTASVDVKVTDFTGSLLSNLLSVKASLNGASSNFQITNVQTDIQNYLISFEVEYTAMDEGEDIADVSLEVKTNLPPFIPISLDLIKIKVVVD